MTVTLEIAPPDIMTAAVREPDTLPRRLPRRIAEEDPYEARGCNLALAASEKQRAAAACGDAKAAPAFTEVIRGKETGA